jgi:phosphatidylglycerophosphate synthase
MKNDTQSNEKRVQQSLVAPVERVALQWLVKRLPEAVTPDHLTILGLLSMLLAGVGYYLSQWDTNWLHIVNFLILVNWFGDSLDGTLARYRKKLRPKYGFYVDHIIDSFGVLFLVGGLALGGFMTPVIALGLLVAYFLISINSFLAAHTIGVFQISFFKFSPTEMRILLGIGNLFLIFKPEVVIAGNTMLLFDVGSMVAIVGMAVVVVISTIRNTMLLYRMERV